MSKDKNVKSKSHNKKEHKKEHKKDKKIKKDTKQKQTQRQKQTVNIEINSGGGGGGDDDKKNEKFNIPIQMPNIVFDPSLSVQPNAYPIAKPETNPLFFICQCYNPIIVLQILKK